MSKSMPRNSAGLLQRHRRDEGDPARAGRDQRVLWIKRPSAFGSPTMGLPSRVIESIKVTGEPFCPALPLMTISSPALSVVLLIPAASMVAGEDNSPSQWVTLP